MSATAATIQPKAIVPQQHHMALKTRNITTAIQFYSLLGWEVETKFRAGPARAAWLRSCSGSTSSDVLYGRLELIEVPSYLLQERPGTKRQAMNLMDHPALLGWNHMALDVTHAMEQQYDRQKENNETAASSSTSLMTRWLQDVNTTSVQRFEKTLRIAFTPRQQIIGQGVYEMAFLYDADGCLVEIIAKIKDLPQSISCGWEPLDENQLSQSMF